MAYIVRDDSIIVIGMDDRRTNDRVRFTQIDGSTFSRIRW
jgi:hypothetical protein